VTYTEEKIPSSSKHLFLFNVYSWVSTVCASGCQ
jgi:hypothetical protein